MINKDELKELKELIDKSYIQIDKGLDRDTIEKIEWSVAKGLDYLVKAQQIIDNVNIEGEDVIE